MAIVRDEWVILCPHCIRADLETGAPVYERAAWREAARSFCLRHRTPLVQAASIPQDIEDCDHMLLRLLDLEDLVAAQLIKFERDIERAYRGLAPPALEVVLTAAEFLQVLSD